MAGVREASVAVFRRPAAAGALADRIGEPDPATVTTAAETAVPLVMEAMGRRLTEPDGRASSVDVGARIDPSGLADPAAALATGRHVGPGRGLADHALGDATPSGRAARTIAVSAGMSSEAAADVLAAVAWVVGANLHRRSGSPPDGDALAAAVLGRSRRPPPPVPTSALAPIVSEPGGAGHRSGPAPVRSSPLGLDTGEVPAVPTASLSTRAPSAAPPRPRPGPAPPGSVPAPAVTDKPRVPTPSPRTPPGPDVDVTVGSSRLVTGLALLLGLLVAGVGLWWWLDGWGDGNATAAELTQPTSADEGDGATDGPADDADTDGDSGGDGQPTADSDGQSTAAADPTAFAADGAAVIDLVMADPTGRTPATGSAGLRLDPDTGELCYDVELDGLATPADGHIHLGPAGVKGGIVVDLGPVDSGDRGCRPVPVTEIDAILADLDGHYVELHDASEEATIRAQLAEGLGPDGQPVWSEEQAGAAPSESDGAVLFDPDGGGAIAIVEPDRIILRGEVPDRETAELVLVDFAGLADVVVVDELAIVDGAPPPSGRVIIDSPASGLFALNDDRLAPGVEPLVDQLVALLEARPDWQVTVVGHTDSTGEAVFNLELSLRRAEAVRRELLSGGVADDRIRVRGAGATDPLADNATAAGRAQNRRIEFEIAR